MKNAIFILITIFTASLAFASVQEGKELFERKCDKCHSLERSLKKSKSLTAWNKTIKRMARYSEGLITEQDSKKIAEYLAVKEQPIKPAFRYPNLGILAEVFTQDHGCRVQFRCVQFRGRG